MLINSINISVMADKDQTDVQYLEELGQFVDSIQNFRDTNNDKPFTARSSTSGLTPGVTIEITNRGYKSNNTFKRILAFILETILDSNHKHR